MANSGRPRIQPRHRPPKSPQLADPAESPTLSGPLAPEAPPVRVYGPPLAAPLESDYRTLDNLRVRLHPTIDPSYQPTQVSLKATKRSFRTPVFGIWTVGIVALLSGGGLSWLLLGAFSTRGDGRGMVVEEPGEVPHRERQVPAQLVPQAIPSVQWRAELPLAPPQPSDSAGPAAGGLPASSTPTSALGLQRRAPSHAHHRRPGPSAGRAAAAPASSAKGASEPRRSWMKPEKREVWVE
jgi:hypothetical protein